MTGPVPPLFDRSAFIKRRLRAAQLNGDAFLAREAAAGLAYRLGAVKRTFARGLNVDSNPGAGAELNPLAQTWERVSLGPEEVLAVPEAHFDLVVSVLSLHAINDLPGLLVQIRRALKPDGVFMAALFAGSTLTELRQSFGAAESEILGGVSPRVAPFADVRDLGSLLQRAGFALPVADIERTVARYRDLSTLITDLRVLGETNILAARNKRFLPRRLLAATASHYAQTFADADGRLRATFEIAYLTGWAPHESQQQPLKPGSAKTRLANVLGTEEHIFKRE